MAALTRAALQDQTVRKQAERLIADLPQKDFQGEVKAIHAWVRDRIRYTMDPVELEYLQAPAVLLNSQQGDCDDKSMLLAALLGVVGHVSRFVAVGPRRRGYCHVFVEVRDRTKKANDPAAWVPLESTENWEAGVGVTWPYRMVQDIWPR